MGLDKTCPRIGMGRSGESRFKTFADECLRDRQQKNGLVGYIHQAYKEYITDLYRSMIDNIDVPEGFPHPMISAMANDYLVDLDQIVFKGVSEGEGKVTTRGTYKEAKKMSLEIEAS